MKRHIVYFGLVIFTIFAWSFVLHCGNVIASNRKYIKTLNCFEMYKDSTDSQQRVEFFMKQCEKVNEIINDRNEDLRNE